MTKKHIPKCRPLIGAAAVFLCAALTGCGGKHTDFRLLEEETAVSAESGGQEEAPIPAPTVTPELTKAPEPQVFYVDVCGAVKNPGVFALKNGSRVFEALKAAGGVLPEGAAQYINQAQLVEDGQQIYIPTQEEARNTPLTGAGEAASQGGGDSASDARVNLNQADGAALCTLSGIGASKAQAILAYREENGGFSSIEELMNVPGIKEGTYNKIKDHIAVE